ncbi:hypothetical protein GCM10009798_40990 [Nocardioides panacihumi]|uniref:Integrase SAM-like N-terminal domain-containing protein n=1 Tax=Nocardioides panacihumi TaxID=400774 RepID=A0ABN2RVJ3_9ACTN
MTHTTLLPFQPDAMWPAQLAAVSYVARYSGHTHTLYAYQLQRWFAWCETNPVSDVQEQCRTCPYLLGDDLGWRVGVELGCAGAEVVCAVGVAVGTADGLPCWFARATSG